MVNLLSGSGVDQSKYPHTYRWDSSVRQHYEKYQRLIDAHTYRLQRIQRGILSLPYPKYYNTELLTLKLLQRKQEVGEVDQTEVDLYKSIDKCVVTHLNRTFNSNLSIPYAGVGIGGSLFAYSTYFNFSIPTRFMLTIAPIAIDWLRITRDPINQHHSLDFLNWVVGYRKAKCFVQKHKKQFENPQTVKVLKNGNIVELGRELIALAQK